MIVRKILCCCLVVLFCADKPYAQSSYLSFLQQQPKAKWASEYGQLFEITPKDRTLGLKAIYSRKAADHASLLMNSLNGTIVTDTAAFLQRETGLYRGYTEQNIDRGNSLLQQELGCDCVGDAFTNRFDIYKIDQVLYYKDARLYINNVLLHPLCLKEVNDEGLFTWKKCFSVPLAVKPGAIRRKRKLVDLGSASQTYDLGYYPAVKHPFNRILTVKNGVLSRLLVMDIMDGRITAVDDDLTVIEPGKLFEYKHHPIEVAAYNNEGEVVGTREVYPEVELDSIYHFSISQHFYHDTVANILYSSVNHVEVLMDVVTSTGVNLGQTVWFRVYFVKPSHYKKPKLSRYLNED